MMRKATEFVILLERGRGDTVKGIIKYWGDMGIDEIHSQVISWKHCQSQSEFRNEKWDKEIEEDYKAGKLNRLIDSAIADIDSGNVKAL